MLYLVSGNGEKIELEINKAALRLLTVSPAPAITTSIQRCLCSDNSSDGSPRAWVE